MAAITSFILSLNAVKCNLMDLTTKSTCVLLEVSGVDTCSCVGIPCACGLQHSVTWRTYRRRSLAFHSVAAHRPGSSPLNKSTLLFLRSFCFTAFLACLNESAFGAVN